MKHMHGIHSVQVAMLACHDIKHAHALEGHLRSCIKTIYNFEAALRFCMTAMTESVGDLG